MIRKLFLIFIVLIFSITNTVSAEVVNVSVSEDSYTDSGVSNENYGELPHTRVAQATRLSYFKISTSEYATEAYLHCYVLNGSQSGYLYATRASNDWSESTLSYTLPPSISPSIYTSSTQLDKQLLPQNGMWVTFNVSSAISYPSNYTFKVGADYAKSAYIASSEYENASLKPYLEIHTAPCPQDLNLNNKTNDDTKAFMVNTSEVVRFSINVPDSENISSYKWFVNKTAQSNNNEYFDFITPVFDLSQPSSGIWEIRVEANYTNGSQIIREWLISGLTTEQAPDFIDYFVDQNNVWRSDYRKDPWGRSQPIYLSTTNFISKGFVQNTASLDHLKSDNLNVRHGTFKVKASHELPSGIIQEFQYKLSNKTLGGGLGMQYAANDNHDYFSANYGKYIPISKRWICPAPGGRSWSRLDTGWREYIIIRTPDDWVYLYENDSMTPESVGCYSDLVQTFDNINILSGSYMKVDCVEIYKDQYLYPPNKIYFGSHPQYRDYLSGTSHVATNADGIILYVHNTTLKQISDSINNESLMIYDDSTKTATVKTSIFIEAGSDFNVTNETLLFDTSSESQYIRPESGCTIRIDNSTVSAAGTNPLVWNFVNPKSMSIFDPVGSPFVTTTPLPVNKGHYMWRGRFISTNSTLDNCCNMYFMGPHEITILDTTFSNMSDIEYGTNRLVPGYSSSKQLSIASGEKSIRFTPCMDIENYKINNISFVNPKEPITLEVVGGQFVVNSTVIKDSDLSNVFVSATEAQKHELLPDYKIDNETSNVSLLNCIVDGTKINVKSTNATIKTKYYADVIVKNANGGPIQNTIMTFSPSVEKHKAEHLYEYDIYVPDSSEAGAGGAYPPFSGDQLINYQGGWYKRWWNAQPLTFSTTNERGRTSFPEENVNNTIVLTDKVWTNATGTQTEESITYNLTINSSGYENITLDSVSPDSAWYRGNTEQSKYTIVAIQNNSEEAHITGYSPSPEYNQFVAGEQLKLQIWASETPTDIVWKQGDDTIATDSMTCDVVVASEPITVSFSGTTSTGVISKTFDIDATMAAPTANFIANTTSGSYPLSVSFTDQTLGGVALYEWDFDNDGIIDSRSPNPTVRYKAPGTYTVSLTVTNAIGTDAITKTEHITVTGDPVIIRITNTVWGYMYNIYYKLFGCGMWLCGV